MCKKLTLEPSDIRKSMMRQSISWKLQQHDDLVSMGVQHSLIRDLLSRNYKTKNYKIWSELPLICARGAGCTFSESTPAKFLREVFVEEVYNVPGFIPRSGETVIDVGANYGDSSIWWSKVFGAKVIAFEPLEDIFRILVENIKMNRANVIPFNLALGTGKPITGVAEGSMFTKNQGDNTKMLHSKRLDDFRFGKIDLLKIDVEGFEIEVLEGSMSAIERYHPKIILETHTSELKQRCHKILTRIGYELGHQGRKRYPGIAGMDEVQNLFYS